MGLFREIRRLSLKEGEHTEDILTEIVASVLRRHPDLIRMWLATLGIRGGSQAEEIQVQTQVPFDALEGHTTDSRVDLVLSFTVMNKKHWVFIESKVGSTQGNQQLRRYAELLEVACLETKANGSLVFITRDYEDVQKPGIEDFEFDFHRSRWFHFYDLLKQRASRDGLERELRHYMEENRMSLGNQFRTSDLMALEHFNSAKSLMDETLDAHSVEWRKLLGKGGRIHRAMGELRRHQRYVLHTKFKGFEVMTGYFLPKGNPDETVQVGLALCCDPKAEARDTIVGAFKNWADSRPTDWTFEVLDAPHDWSILTRRKPLNHFLAEKDHVQAVKDWLGQLIQNLADFKQSYPALPWTPVESKEDEDA
jgi:hypothetical protein